MSASVPVFAKPAGPRLGGVAAQFHRKPTAPGKRLRSKLAAASAALAVPGALVALWYGITALNLLPPLVLPAPASVLGALRDMAVNGDLAGNLGISLQRAALGFVAGAAFGLVGGALIGLSPGIAALCRPTLSAFVQVPVLAWIPLLMIPFGIGETLKLVAIGMAAFTPVVLNTAKGFSHVPRGLLEIGTIFRLTWWQRSVHILLPGALPTVFTGLRLGLTQAWHILVVVELVASTEGIGYMAVMARQMFQLDVVLATMAVIGLVGAILDRSLRSAEAALARHYGAATA